jgi:hypothetical protein
MSGQLFTGRLLDGASSSDASGVPRDRLVDVQLAATVAFFGRAPAQRVALSAIIAAPHDADEIAERTVVGATAAHLQLDDGSEWPTANTTYAHVAAKLVSPQDDDVCAVPSLTVSDRGSVGPDDEDAACFDDLGEMHPAEELLVGTVKDFSVNGAPLLRLPFLSWLFEKHRAVFVVVMFLPSPVFQLALFALGPQWSPDAHAAFHVAVHALWTLNGCMVSAQYQRGVLALVLRSYDVWYVSLNLFVLYFVSYVDRVITYGLPLWVFVTFPFYCANLCLVLLTPDAMPDHRFRVALMAVAFNVVAFLTLQSLFISPIRNVAIHSGFTYQTTWGALAATSGGTLLAFLARALLKSAMGTDFLVVVGLERLSRRQRREAAHERNVAKAEVQGWSPRRHHIDNVATAPPATQRV